MAGPGYSINIPANSRTDPTTVMALARQARNAAIRAMVDMLYQDYDEDTRIYRGAFRAFGWCPIPTDPASMSVQLLAGSGIFNDVALDLLGNWYILRCPGETAPAHDAAHPTLDRYDILSLQLKETEVGPATYEFRDPASGNIYSGTANGYLRDDYDLVIDKGKAGGADPSVTRLTAYTLVDAGKIPIAVVRIRAGATSIALEDIQDVREIAILKQVADDYDIPADAIAQMYDIIPPMGLSMPAQATTVDGVTNMSVNTLFWDAYAGALKYRDPDGTIHTITTTT